MKWSCFQKKFPEDIASKAIALCNELHSCFQKYNCEHAKFCEYCFNSEGKYSFPCGDVRDEFLKRYGKSLEELL